jgi:hypothetical protein
MRSLWIILIIFSSAAHTQPNVSLHVGKSFRSHFSNTYEASFLSDFWHDGPNIGISAEWPLNGPILLAAGGEYSLHQWSGRQWFNTVPEEAVVSISGGETHVYRFLGEIGLSTPAQYRLRMLLKTGVAYTIEDLGDLTAVVQELTLFTDKSLPTPTRYRWDHTVGLQIRYFLFESFAIDLEGRYFSDYSESLDRSVRLGLTYAFEAVKRPNTR